MFFYSSQIQREEKKDFDILVNSWQVLCKRSQAKEVGRKEQELMKELREEKEKKSQGFYLTEGLNDLTNRYGKIALLKTKKSSNIFGVGYRGNLLYILFNTYTIYTYENVPLHLVGYLLRAIKYGEKESIGKYFNANIKKGNYPYKNMGVASALKPKS